MKKKIRDKKMRDKISGKNTRRKYEKKIREQNVRKKYEGKNMREVIPREKLKEK